MTTDNRSDDRDREARQANAGFPLALFVIAELLCTGALIALIVL